MEDRLRVSRQRERREYRGRDAMTHLGQGSAQWLCRGQGLAVGPGCGDIQSRHGSLVVAWETKISMVTDVTGV